jgi:hypothetical protein
MIHLINSSEGAVTNLYDESKIDLATRRIVGCMPVKVFSYRQGESGNALWRTC